MVRGQAWGLLSQLTVLWAGEEPSCSGSPLYLLGRLVQGWGVYLPLLQPLPFREAGGWQRGWVLGRGHLLALPLLAAYSRGWGACPAANQAWGTKQLILAAFCNVQHNGKHV